MSEQTQAVEQEFKPFTQTPEWKAEDNFIVSGKEFQDLYNFFNIFMPAVNAMQSTFERAIRAGTVTIKHEYTDNSGEVPKEELERYFKRFNEIVEAEKAKAEQPQESKA